jgi:DnaJ-class molecular chaperone
MSLQWHPDKNSDKKDTPNVDEHKVVAEEKFREIATAYQQLLVRHVDGARAEDDSHCINR